MVETTGPARMCPVQRAAGSEAKDDMTEVMSDKDLLDALDPDQPGLESVAKLCRPRIWARPSSD